MKEGIYMAQLALYRTWRPQRFEEVVGQEQTVRALRNAVEQGRISHAYLFSGPRGTGKTSVAKILAKAVNCSARVDGEPCDQCSSCQEIKKGNFMDVIEIDAASNRGIDEIRDLREKVRIAPAQGKTKVYIIDEVHMLTTEAFNALLKTLEEPPRSVIFILATTEPHKIPATILSRCQKYDFRRLTAVEIVDRLQLVAVDKGVQVEQNALEVIARRATGSLRDGLSMLDQCLVYSPERITRDNVLDILGLVDDRFLADTFDNIVTGDIAGVITCIDRVMNRGKEARQFAREASVYLRDMLVLKTVGQQAELNLVTGETRPLLSRQAKKLDVHQILAALKKMVDLTGELRFGESQRFMLEVAFLELITIMGSQITTGALPSVSTARPGPDPVQAAIEVNQGAVFPPSREGVPWTKILEKVKSKRVTTHALLAEARCLGMKDDLVLIGFKKGFNFHRERMRQKDNREILLQAMEEVLNRKVEVEFVILGEAPEDDPLVRKAIEMFGGDLIQIKD